MAKQTCQRGTGGWAKTAKAWSTTDGCLRCRWSWATAEWQQGHWCHPWWIMMNHPYSIPYGWVPAWLFKRSNSNFTFGGQQAQQIKRQRWSKLQWKVRTVQRIKWKTTSLTCIPLVGASFCFFWRCFFVSKWSLQGIQKFPSKNAPFWWGKKSPWLKQPEKKVRKKQCAGDRWFRVEGHLHLGLGLTLGKIYAAADLKRPGAKQPKFCGVFFFFFLKTASWQVLAKVIQRQTSWNIGFCSFSPESHKLWFAGSAKVIRKSLKSS